MEVAKRKWTPSPVREARYESERRAIIRAAYRLIGRETGFVSVQDILEEAGLSTRAFYRHFASKDELILFMYSSDNERVAAAQWAATEETEDPWEALRAWVDVSLSVAYDQAPGQHSRVLSSGEARSAQGWFGEYLKGIARSLASLEALLSRGVNEGSFHSEKPGADAQIIFGATGHLTSLRVARGDDAMSRRQAVATVMSAAERLLGRPNLPRPARRTTPSRSAPRR